MRQGPSPIVGPPMPRGVFPRHWTRPSVGKSHESKGIYRYHHCLARHLQRCATTRPAGAEIQRSLAQLERRLFPLSSARSTTLDRAIERASCHDRARVQYAAFAIKFPMHVRAICTRPAGPMHVRSASDLDWTMRIADVSRGINVLHMASSLDDAAQKP